MKITKIQIKDYLHFKKDLVIDLTYPQGHNLAGQPLKKICFLGQSGTGKTILLNLIRYFVTGENSNPSFDKNKLAFDTVEIFFDLKNEKFSKFPATNVGEFTYTDCHRSGNAKIDAARLPKHIEPLLADCKPKLINYPFNIVKSEEASEDITRQQANFNTIDGELVNSLDKTKDIWDFTEIDLKHIWNLVFYNAKKYINQYETKKLEEFEKIRRSPKEAGTIINELEKWEEDDNNKNPIEQLAEKWLNPILNKFKLEVETNLLKYRKDDGGWVNLIIKSQTTGEIIEYPYLSTGTKQVILTSIPLFFLEPKQSIILFDQPETSLYPNVQYLLPDTYQEIASAENQFFYATHSPIVASSFEPWEIVELDFDEDNRVGRKEYFKGGRSVDNYFLIPKLLRWDSSYKLLFNLDHFSSEDRAGKLMELATLEQKIIKEQSIQKKQEMIIDYKKLAEQLDWYTEQCKK